MKILESGNVELTPLEIRNILAHSKSVYTAAINIGEGAEKLSAVIDRMASVIVEYDDDDLTKTFYDICQEYCIFDLIKDD